MVKRGQNINEVNVPYSRFKRLYYMKISGNSTVNASCEAIWELIFDPTTLLQLLPGCDHVEQVDPDQYKATLTMRVPALSGSYEILIKIAESKAPQFCRLEGSARGPSGGVQGSGTLNLQPSGRANSY